MRRRIRCVALAMTLWCLLPHAQAIADPPQSVIEVLPPEQVTAAVHAAHVPTAVNLARSNLGIPAQTDTRLHVADRGVCVYRLNPSFRQGQSHAVLAVPGYVAVSAKTSDGRTTTLQVAQVPPAEGGASSWAAVAAAQDDTEARLAQDLGKNAVLFEHQGPHGREWFELDEHALRPLSIENGRIHRAAAIPIATYVKSLRQATAQPPSTAPSKPSSEPDRDFGTEIWALAGTTFLLTAGALVILLRPHSRRRASTAEHTASS